MANELLSPGKIPAFDKIKPEDYMPAIDAAIAEIEQKLKAIKGDTAPATFENTVVPLDSLFDKIGYITLLLGNEVSNVSTDALQAVEEAVSIKVANFEKNIFQDQGLGKRFQSVYAQRDKLPLDDDDKAILRNLFQSFESSGALLTPQGQQRIRAIDEQLITLSQKFMKNLKAAPLQQAVLVTDKAELAGLSPEETGRMEENARENGHPAGWLFIPERLMVDEFLEHAESASFRKKIGEALERMGKDAPYNNSPVIAEMQKLRYEYAQLLGYANYAEFARSRAMTKDLGAVRKLLEEVEAKALPKFEEEMRGLEKFAAANGGPARLDPWDVPYWVNRQREALYHFDANAFAKNLELENVLKGMFDQATRVFGLEFKETTGKYPVMDPDTRTFDVTNKQTGEVSILHVDLYARPGAKTGGAWMSQLQTRTADKPNIVIFNLNITKPPAGKKALVAFSQYSTMYHEFGHALQGIQGLNVKYPSLAGPAGPSDFVEFHSMVNEHRATIDDNLQKFARNVDTGLPPDAKTVDALLKSQSFFASRELLKLVQNSLRDLEFHTMNPADYKGDQAVEDAVALKSPYAAHIRPYSLTRFDHLFSDGHSGYAAGYVNYLIAQEHAADGFVPFRKDPYSVKWSKRLKDLYSRGSGGEPSELYKQFRGRAANPTAMLEDAGIEVKAKANKKSGGPKP
jgi:peptidyl-dipeptidase Dcp